MFQTPVLPEYSNTVMGKAFACVHGGVTLPVPFGDVMNTLNTQKNGRYCSVDLV